MKRQYHQSGMTLIGLLFLLALIGFFVLLGLRLAPVYLEASKVKTVLAGLQDESGISKKNKREILKMMRSRYDINDIRYVDLGKTTQINKTAKAMVIRVVYERREPFLGNVDLIVSFDEETRIPLN